MLSLDFWKGLDIELSGTLQKVPCSGGVRRQHERRWWPESAACDGGSEPIETAEPSALATAPISARIYLISMERRPSNRRPSGLT
ncbi:hypothetical protein F0562_022465 [Nyssa sinensis]|uniref:Uncharacterized protein n=1 Tax=Nyssa sinensis TaxID=561372 RepID=A0A5J5BN34_9ASTE|nr:hypothetical protein F0562_022465 [Nyssa sinensis]